MTSDRRDRTQIASNGVALLFTIILVAALLATRPDSWRDSLVRPASVDQPGIEVSLQQAPAETPPAPAPPTPPVTRKVVPVHGVMPQQAASAEMPAPTEPQAMPVEQKPVPEGGALVASSGTTASAESVFRPDLETQYAAGLRADIDRRTRPPDSVQYRLRHPSGEVRLGFIVMRDGEPTAVRVLRSSGSSILDEAAVVIVASGRYPPMPAKVFAGETEHSFAVTIEFRATS